MSSLKDIKTVYFLGIGGIGMSGLARYFKLHGSDVSGYDKTATPLTQQLESEGIRIHYTPSPESVPSNSDLIIYTPAIPSDHPEWDVVRSRNAPLMKRAEVLGLISDSGNCLAIAGTHGKTTTSAILAHVLNAGFGQVNAFIGGIMSNYDTNFLYGADSDNYVVEADEFDRSFLFLHPEIAVINSMDADHLDIYGAHDDLKKTFHEFSSQVVPGGKLLVHELLKQEFIDQDYMSFGTMVESDFSAQKIHVANGRFVFDLKHPNGTISEMSIALPGRHNVENAVAACAIALLKGMKPETVRESLASFKGVKRRFEITKGKDDVVYIDDYAHHPTELSRVHEAARELFPNRKMTAIFQPHLFSRTQDFENEFAQELDSFDEVILLDIYPARELPIPGVTSENLRKKMQLDAVKVMSKNDVLPQLENEDLDVILTLGAGDIDTLIEPIKEFIG